MKYCSKCGQANEDDTLFCMQCGAKLEEGIPGAQLPPPPPGQTAGPGPVVPPGQAAPPGAQPVAPPQGQAVGQPPQAPVPGAAVPGRAQQTDGLAIASLILSVFSFIGCPLFAAILGVIFGYMSLSKIEESRGALGGEELARAGVIIGWVHIGLVVLAAIIILVLVITGVIVSNS